MIRIDLADIIASSITILFGAIHCFAWTFQFPSPTEQFLWRIASLVTITAPTVWAIVYSISLVDDCKHQYGKRIGQKTMDSLSAIAVPVYLIARTILIGLAFSSIRSLPCATYETVFWTRFIPHI